MIELQLQRNSFVRRDRKDIFLTTRGSSNRGEMNTCIIYDLTEEKQMEKEWEKEEEEKKKID